MEDGLIIAKSEDLGSLLGAVARGDRLAFDQLYQSTSRRLYPIVRRIVVLPDLAEDVLQETYLTVWRKADQYDQTKGSALVWMAAIARNRSIDRLRRSNSRPRLDVAFEDVESGAEKLVAANAADDFGDSATVRQCVEALQPKHRKAILLGFFYGMTHEEMASHLHAPLGTVKSWVRRGLHQLKECCGQ